MEFRALRQTASLPTLLLALAEVIPVYCVIAAILVSDPYPFLLVAAALLAPRLLTPVLFDGEQITARRRYMLYAVIVANGLLAIRIAVYPDRGVFDVTWIADALRGLALVESGQRRMLWATALLTGYAWWRALQRNENDVGAAYRLLRGGTVSLVIVALLLIPLGNRSPIGESQLVLAALAFYATVLLGLSTLRKVPKPSAERSRTAWLASAATPVILILLLSTAIAGLLSGQVRETLSIPFEPGFHLVSFLLEGLIKLITLLLMLILRPIAWFVGWIISLLEGLFGPSGSSIATPTPVEDPDPRPTGELPGLPDPVGYALAALAIVGGVWLLARLLLRVRPQPASGLREERSSVFDWHEQVDALGGRLRRPKATTDDPLGHLRGRPEWAETLRIRERYAAFQRWGSAKGRGRTRGETANQYGSAIHRGLLHYPEAQRAVDALTARYRKARYSGRPASRAEADEADAAVDEITRAGGPPDEE